MQNWLSQLLDMIKAKYEQPATIFEVKLFNGGNPDKLEAENEDGGQETGSIEISVVQTFIYLQIQDGRIQAGNGHGSFSDCSRHGRTEMAATKQPFSWQEVQMNQC